MVATVLECVREINGTVPFARCLQYDQGHPQPQSNVQTALHTDPTGRNITNVVDKPCLLGQQLARNQRDYTGQTTYQRPNVSS
jgi:hypothetical protein